MLNSVFRVDASYTIGSGHVMRCVTLANEIKKNNGKIVFICRELPGNMCDFIESKGYIVYRLPHDEKHLCDEVDPRLLWSGESSATDWKQTLEIVKRLSSVDQINWLVVDHYALDAKWEEKLRYYVDHIMVIDDLADRRHVCDLLLDQNLYENMYSRYRGLISEECKTLLGPQFVILRQEFYQKREKVKIRNGKIENILIFFGGSDITNETQKVLVALKMLNRLDIHIDVVVGNMNRQRETIRKICNEMGNALFHFQIDYMAELMIKADLAIGAGGTTTWERCFLGLPAITIILAENQKATTEAVARKGAVINLGWYAEVNVMDIYHKVLSILNNADHINKMSLRALEICSNSSGVSGLDAIAATMINMEN